MPRGDPKLPMTHRFDPDLVQELEDHLLARNRRRVNPITRTDFIEQAIREKLDRDKPSKRLSIRDTWAR